MHCNRRIAACRSAPTQLVACAVILGKIAGPFPVQHTAKIHADALRMVCMLSVGLLPGAECLLQWSQPFRTCCFWRRFAPHLEKCLGKGRNASRLASRRNGNG